MSVSAIAVSLNNNSIWLDLSDGRVIGISHGCVG
jgi:hypothetical protein